MSSYLGALIGGILIGISTSLMLWCLGRISGISGIYSSVLTPRSENFWKYSFLLGLVTGGVVLKLFFHKSLFDYHINAQTPKIIIAGLLVGFGTRLGSGCTSGHGVCGIPRLSPRSILATLIFILVGIITVGLEGAFK